MSVFVILNSIKYNAYILKTFKCFIATQPRFYEWKIHFSGLQHLNMPTLNPKYVSFVNHLMDKWTSFIDWGNKWKNDRINFQFNVELCNSC